MPHPTRSLPPSSALAARPPRALRQRRRQRGATIFLVTLVMTLLTGLGIFAARATSLSSRAAGYVRQNDQSHYLAQHGMILALNVVSKASAVYGDSNPNNKVTHQLCSTSAINAVVASKTPCAKFSTSPIPGGNSFDELLKASQSQAGKTVTPAITMPPTTDPTTDPGQNFPSGSLGPALLLPSMYVELTDYGQMDRPPAGTAVQGGGSEFKYVLATLIGWGQVGPYPLGGPTPTCNGAAEKGSTLAMSREGARAQIMFSKQ